MSESPHMQSSISRFARGRAERLALQSFFEGWGKGRDPPLLHPDKYMKYATIAVKLY